MVNRFSNFKWIHNFPSRFPWLKRIIFNIGFFLFSIKLIKKITKITGSDLFHIKIMLRKGDIILLGALTIIYPIFFDEVLTHSAIYMGGGKVIHSTLKGVNKIKLKKLLPSYDTAVILRLPKKINKRRKIIRSIRLYALNKIGLPYNFDFKNDDTSYYCTQLVIDALNNSGYKINIKTFRRESNKGNKIRSLIYGKVRAIHPSDLTKGNLELIYMSDNLYMDDKKNIRLKEKYK